MTQSSFAKSALAALAVLAIIAVPQSVKADNLPATFGGAGTVTSGNTTVNVNATASFSIDYTTGILTLDLTNNIIDAQNALQMISGIEFTVTPPGTSLTSFTATGDTIDLSTNPITKVQGANLHSQAVVTTNTVTIGTFFDTSVLPGTGADFTIIGWGQGGSSYATPGTYTGNPSVTGPTHNPHILHTAHFEFKLAGVSNPSQISNVKLEFGTTSDAYGTFTLPPPPVVSVPEPSSLALAGLGGLGLVVTAIRRRRAAV